MTDQDILHQLHNDHQQVSSMEPTNEHLKIHEINIGLAHFVSKRNHKINLGHRLHLAKNKLSSATMILYQQ